MDTSKMRVPLKGVAKSFKAGLQSKTWDIHGMPHFVTTMHHEGCDMYALHVIEASRALTVEIPSREVKKAFWITWLNIVCQIEDEASSKPNKKVEWYSDCHNNLTDDIRLVEEKAATECNCHQKADEKLAQANSRFTELEAKLVGLQRELTVLQKQDKRTPINQGNSFDFSDSESEATSSQSSRKSKKGQAFPQPSTMRASSLIKLVVSTGQWGDADDARISFSTSGRASGHTTCGTPTHIKDHSTMGEGWPPILVTGMLPRPLRKT